MRGAALGFAVCRRVSVICHQILESATPRSTPPHSSTPTQSNPTKAAASALGTRCASVSVGTSTNFTPCSKPRPHEDEERASQPAHPTNPQYPASKQASKQATNQPTNQCSTHRRRCVLVLSFTRQIGQPACCRSHCFHPAVLVQTQRLENCCLIEPRKNFLNLSDKCYVSRGKLATQHCWLLLKCAAANHNLFE